MAQLREAVLSVINRSMKESAVVVEASIQKNFQSGGRPTWTPAKEGGRGGALLMHTARLARSVLVSVVAHGGSRLVLEARTQNIAYAAIHQFGGVIHPTKAKALAVPLTAEARAKGPREWPPGTLFPIRKHSDGNTVGVLCSNGKGGAVIPQYALRRSVTIPKRPYILLQENDWQDITNIFYRNANYIVLHELS